MNAAKALAEGFTNHGKYFGIPVWLAEEGDGLRVAAKWPLGDALITLAATIEDFLREAFFPERPPMFQFWMGPKIEGVKE